MKVRQINGEVVRLSLKAFRKLSGGITDEVRPAYIRVLNAEAEALPIKDAGYLASLCSKYQELELPEFVNVVSAIITHDKRITTDQWLCTFTAMDVKAEELLSKYPEFDELREYMASYTRDVETLLKHSSLN